MFPRLTRVVISPLYELLSCPFPSDGPWELGATVRDSVFLASKTLTGATGPLSMSVGEDHDGRDVDTVTFCAVNLRPHTTWGARFETIGALDGGTLEANTADGFQVRTSIAGGSALDTL